MLLILNDDTKLRPVETCDHITSIKVKQPRKWVKSGLLSPEVSYSIQSVGSIRPCLYGLPKNHKDSVPLRPILSMVGSAQQKVASWFSSVLQPMLEHFSCFCVKDFSKIIRNFSPTDMFVCSLDICSLYINVPLEETIEICCDILFHSSLPKPIFPESFQKIWLILLPPLSSLASITCIDRLTVWRWVKSWSHTGKYFLLVLWGQFI